MKKDKGFTLFELMVVIAIMGVVAAIAFPTLLKALPVMGLKGTSRDVYSAVMTAKILALKNGNYAYVQFNPVFPSPCVSASTAVAPPYAITYKNSAGVVVCYSTAAALPTEVAFNLSATPAIYFSCNAAPADVSNPNNYANLCSTPNIKNIGAVANNEIVFNSQGIPVDLNGNYLQAPQVIGLKATSNGQNLEKRNVILTISGGVSITR